MATEVCSHWSTFVTQSLATRPIYKDECAKCYLTPRHENGLNVCLSCLQGVCGNPNNNHLELHVKNSYKSHAEQHPIYMNIKMTEKQYLQNGEELFQEITKLAIGKPGGINMDADRWLTETSVFCTACNVIFSNDNLAVQQMTQVVLNAQSAFKDDMVKEWELELVACPHTKRLDQSGARRMTAQDMVHCHNCDKKENLWLCLSCGNLGCGRR